MHRTVFGIAEYALESESSFGHIGDTHDGPHRYRVFEMYFWYPPNARAVAPMPFFSAFHCSLIHWAKYTRFILHVGGTAITEPIAVRNIDYAITSLEHI